MKPEEVPFTTQIAFKPHGPNALVFETVQVPLTMGNPLKIAYGGYALATACKAASLTTPKTHHLYSLMGHYLGPAFADRTLHASVRIIRQTRAFATRQIEVSQKRDDGELRICLIAIADFQAPEKATLLTYSRQPSRKFSHWKDLPTQAEQFQKLVDNGKATAEMLETQGKLFSLIPPIFEQRQCPEGIFVQNIFGVANPTSTTQDHLAIADKSTGDWFRCKQNLDGPIDHVSLLAFMTDGAIAFAPLSFNNLWFESISACSSLEFALRIFQNGKEDERSEGLDLNKWHLREMSTSVGAEGRTYGESWVWDEHGRAVACMSQQSIMRPAVKKDIKGKL